MNNSALSTYDLVIVGTGAAGLMAALTALDRGARVCIVEADSWIGGATALSEGMIWVPNNPEARALSDAPAPEEEAESALAYLRATAGNFFDSARVDLYIAQAPKALDLANKLWGYSFFPEPILARLLS